jgi:NitT/TauT family transport system ATP-binding protein
VTTIVEPDIPRGADVDSIRRDPVYLDTVEEIWRSLKQHLD